MNEGLSVTLFPQVDGWTNVLMRGLVLGAERDPMPKLLMEIVQRYRLNPAYTRWYECWLENGWGQMLPAWDGSKCIRVDWKPINPETATQVVNGSCVESPAVKGG